MRKHIDVVAAILIDKNHKVFCAKRINQGELALKWEFPGGKIETGEHPEDALKREILEELNISLLDIKYFMTVHHSYNTFDITLQSYICSGIFDELQLNIHDDVRWMDIDNLLSLDWADADLPIVIRLMGVYQ